MELQLRYRARVRWLRVRERVAEALPNPLFHEGFAIQRHGLSQIELHDADIIQPEDMIGVLVGVHHGMNQPDPFAQQLETQVGWRVDQEIALGKTEYGRTSRAPVVWIVAAADRASAADGRHAYRGPRAQDYELAWNIRRERRLDQAWAPL